MIKAFQRSEVVMTHLPGRIIQKAVGQDSFSASQKMTVGFAYYSAESGPMEPHQHAEETIYVVDARDGWVAFGPEKNSLPQRFPLEAGMVLHIPEMEWHAFQYEQDGFVDVMFIYGQSDNIRPEDRSRNR